MRNCHAAVRLLRQHSGSVAVGALLLSGFVLVSPAFAQALLPAEDHGNIYTVRIENDTTGRTDEYYTSGVQLGWTGPTGTVPGFIARAGHALLGPGNQRISIDIGQQIYTPSNTQLSRPIRTTGLMRRHCF